MKLIENNKELFHEDRKLIKEIEENNKKIEYTYNQIDEWIISRDRSSFYLTHDFHPYFAAYPPELVKRLLLLYSDEGDKVLDCFMGGGSAIVEILMNKRIPYGVDISPLSKLVTEVKARPIEIDKTHISNILSKMEDDINVHRKVEYNNFDYYIPNVTNIDYWFEPKVKYELAIILKHINDIQDIPLKEFLSVGFSSILRKVSNAKNAEQHLCIWKGKKIPEVFPMYYEKVNLMTNQMNEYYRLTKQLSKSIDLDHIFCHDVRYLDEIIESNSIDLIITSPPYGTGSRYTDVNRLSFEWLDLKKPEGKSSLEKNINSFDKELKVGIKQMYKVLKNDSYCCIVYGDPSDERGLTKKLIEDCIKTGFYYLGLISCPIVKRKKRGTKYRQYIPKDFILIFKKM